MLTDRVKVIAWRAATGSASAIQYPPLPVSVLRLLGLQFPQQCPVLIVVAVPGGETFPVLPARFEVEPVHAGVGEDLVQEDHRVVTE